MKSICLSLGLLLYSFYGLSQPISCNPPADITLTCDEYDPSLTNYGLPNLSGALCLDSTKFYEGQFGLSHEVDYSQFDTFCTSGTITRSFQVFDCLGNSDECSQTIQVEHVQGYFIRFPDDVLVSECTGDELYGAPVIGGGGCANLEISYTDERFNVVPNACYKIRRTWNVVNLCSFDINLPLVEVPNPHPHLSPNNPVNNLGPVVSAPGSIQPWTSTITNLYPADSVLTDYSSYWEADGNGYSYVQVLTFNDSEPPVFHNCPAQVSICSVDPNAQDLWNHQSFFDPFSDSTDLCEAPADISITVIDSCSGSDINLSYRLYLDLNGDGVTETEISSTDLPLPGETPFQGGTPFDQRQVPLEQKYRFGIDWVDSGASRVAYLRMDWLDAPIDNEDNELQGIAPILPLGKHRIKWYAHDACWNQATCEFEFEIKDCAEPDVQCKSTLSMDMPVTDMIKLWASDFLDNGIDNCTPSEQLEYGVIRTIDSNWEFPLDGNGEPITDLTYYCDDIGPDAVQLWARDAAGNAGFSECYILIQDANSHCGNYTISIAGKVATELGEGLEEASLRLESNPSSGPDIDVTTYSVENGYYLFAQALPLFANYRITPFKDDNPINGVTTFDLVLISKHVLGLTPLNSPYKIIAADANKSRSVTTFDVVELRKLILGIYDELPNNTSWRFFESEFVFPDPSNPFPGFMPEYIHMSNVLSDQLNEEFIAVKVGDVNNSAIASSLMSSDDRSNGTLVFDVENREVKAGEKFEVTFTAAEQVLGYQFTLNFEGLELVNIEPGAGMNHDNFGIFEDAITTSYNGREAGTFTVSFHAVESGLLSSMLHVSSRITKAEAYNAERLEVALRFDGNYQRRQYFELYQNVPNPWVNQTQIGFYLAEETPVTLKVFNQNGRLIYSQKRECAEGFNAFTLEDEHVDVGGVLICRIETNSDVGILKMIKTK